MVAAVFAGLFILLGLSLVSEALYDVAKAIRETKEK